jgi:hypothetical protein
MHDLVTTDYLTPRFSHCANDVKQFDGRVNDGLKIVWERDVVAYISLLLSYIYGAPCNVRNFNVVYIWPFVWQR